MKIFGTFKQMITATLEALRDRGAWVPAGKWQSTDVAGNPALDTLELLNWSFQVPISGILDDLRRDISPTLPWADDHFAERVGGFPLNPGQEWRNWPWSRSADRFRGEDERFTHTYAERIWPRYAGKTVDSEKTEFPANRPDIVPNTGIRYEYGDLNDLAGLLRREPETRQAYLPIWFPEDTGCRHGGRIPCSIGYHVIQRGGYLHMTYQLRSCDFVRHFRDDVYLAARLLLWIRDQVNPKWRAGLFTMHVTSLHVFRGDCRRLFGGERKA